MFSLPRIALLAAVLTMGLLVPSVRAAAPEIRDGAKLFDPAAVQQAEKILNRIELRGASRCRDRDLQHGSEGSWPRP